MANKKGKGNLAVFGLVAVIVIAVFFIVRAVVPERPPVVEMPPMSWICMECEFRTPVVEEPVLECPECGGYMMMPDMEMMPPEMMPLPPAE